MPHHHHPGDTTLSDFVSGLVKYVVIAIGLVAVLQQLGVQATSVLAVLGAASLAIGLALQGALSNVAGGVMILMLRPYRVGDRVDLNGRQGKVVDLDLFNTTVVDYDGLTLYFPNGKVFGELIINVDQLGRRRVDLTRRRLRGRSRSGSPPASGLRLRRRSGARRAFAMGAGHRRRRQRRQRHPALLDYSRRLAEHQGRFDQNHQGAVRRGRP